MKLNNKLSFALGNCAGAVAVVVFVAACGGGGGGGGMVGVLSPAGGGSGNSSDPGVIRASNIILKGGATQTASGGNGGFIRVQANQLPDDVQVLASNVSLVNTSNDLSSTDLQSALDKEIAVNLSKVIVGVWDVQNLTSDSTYGGDFASGKVEFRADGSYTILSGGFAAAGKVAAGTSSFCTVPATMNYTLVDGAVYFKASSGGDSVSTVAKATSNAVTLIGDGGCGAQGTSRISRLTRASVQPASFKPSAQPELRIKVAATS